MTISQYLEQINARYKSGLATEHTYRGDLQQLIESLVKDVTVTNEPARIRCGAPDYIITRNEIPVGYIEAKDIGKNIADKNYKEQFERYRKSLNNLIITDYIDFWFYTDGELRLSLRIAELDHHTIKPLPRNFEQFTVLIQNFCVYTGQTIKSASKLSKMMAAKAKLLSQVIEKALTSDVDNDEDSSLKEQMYAFKDILIHDIKPRDFADIYAQTIAYGMFAARLHDTTLDTFTRQKAADLIPKTNPFLRKLFQYIAGYDLDSRIVWIVDALADIFRATDVAALLQNFGKSTQMNDPIIHFYETFLAEYDPALRKARGVWYTPEPVVNFIVRAVDDILKTEFNLPQGLADSSKIKVKRKAVTQATTDRRSKLKEVETEEEIHKVQILDPATGTGTFLAEVVKQVYGKFKGMQGVWNGYVENHLIPRLNGFELLMASYAMAHLKLDMLLAETGYKSTKNQRFRVYLTNSLEEHHADTGTLFASWLSSEANEANHIKRDTPVMVVIGNPPYSISSSNKGTWILNLIADYKKDLNERKLNLDDDYIKFIRYGQHFVEKNGEGILAYITNNSFIDGITHRQMRKCLLNTFNDIYILNLHGNSNIQERSPDGDVDHNVFDIMQGVSINILIKKNNGKPPKVRYIDYYGSRDLKYKNLLCDSISNISWTELNCHAPNYFFSPKDLTEGRLYELGFKVNELFIENNTGIQTKCDELSIQYTKNAIQKVIDNFTTLTVQNLKSIYLKKETSGWNYTDASNDLKFNNPVITKILYRPFDTRYSVFTGKSGGFIGRPRVSTMKHLLHENNISLSLKRQSKHAFSYVFTHRNICESCLFESAYANNQEFPLYCYYEDSINLSSIKRIPNLNKTIIEEIAKTLDLNFSNEKEPTKILFSPIDLLDYIYAVLHSPTYRETYKEFLKIDFPRVPYPTNADTFWQLVQLGGELRSIHLLESSKVNEYITSYPQEGDNVVNAVRYDAGRVYINQTQYFDNVPAGAWQFYIGGYQPAQKWLKDRKGRELSFEDIMHYQSIIVALHETERIMNEIDKIEI